jgi:hypothetical protein
MQSKPGQKFELFANIAIIPVAILLGYFLIQRFFFQQNPQASQSPTEIAKGTKISLPEVMRNENQKTMLLVLQKGYKFVRKVCLSINHRLKKPMREALN